MGGRPRTRPPEVAAVVQHYLHGTVPARLIPIMMCLVPIRDPQRPYALTWDEWMPGVDWGLVIFIGGVLGIGPSRDDLLPSGTTTNAIVAGSGYLRVSTMVRHGIILFLLHTLLLAFVGYPLAKPVTSW